ncbi:hypothetical protein [Faecalibacterium sp. Marseille-P9312]|nr:hypothetical protein [Faecalibacterium sp. Marseille-P9312]
MTEYQKTYIELKKQFVATNLRTSGLYCGGYHAFQRTSRSCAQRADNPGS